MAADSQSTVALNIGSQRIGMAVFEPSKGGGLVLKAFDSITILADPATEMARVPQVGIAVSELAQKLKVGKSKVRYAISGQAVFTRFVKLPPLEDDNIEQIVTFEAQQHVPFPINEVVWDYQLLESGGDKEVVLVAIKGDALDEINDAVNETGVGTAGVDVAPMALYNALRTSVEDLTQPTLLIDIGAKTTNLLYAEGRKFFTRSVAIGGVSLTTAISKEYGVPFSEAESQKVSNGLVALGGGHTESLEESVAALAMTLRNALSRLPAEIARTTNYYRSQHGGSAPQRILLAGGGANMPYVKEFFEEKLRLPVEFFNPLAGVTVSKGVDVERLQREAHMMGELVGLGLRGIGKSTINIDLVPDSVRAERASERRKPFLVATAAALIICAGLFGFWKNSAGNKAGEMAEAMQDTVDSLKRFEPQLHQLNQKQQKLGAIANSYVATENRHNYWIGLLDELKEGMASDMLWIVDFDPLVDYNPLAEKRSESGTGVIRKDFSKAPFGTSALNNVRPAPVAPQPTGRRRRGRAQPPPQPKTPEINAIKVRGLWRLNPSGAKVVNQALDRLREDSHHFKFVLKDSKGGEQRLSDEQIIITNITTSEKGEFALPFEMVLPLKQRVPFK